MTEGAWRGTVVSSRRSSPPRSEITATHRLTVSYDEINSGPLEILTQIVRNHHRC